MNIKKFLLVGKYKEILSSQSKTDAEISEQKCNKKILTQV